MFTYVNIQKKGRTVMEAKEIENSSEKEEFIERRRFKETKTNLLSKGKRCIFTFKLLLHFYVI